MDNIGEVAVTQDERTMGVLAHVLQVVGWWIAPLIIFLVKRESKFVSFHALQALLFQIIYLFVWIAIVVAMAVAMIASAAAQGMTHSSQPPTALLVMIPIFWLASMGGWVTMIVIAIVYGIKAGRGEWAKYPLIGSWAARMLKLQLSSAA